jgi:hypothetical protein
VPRSKFLYDWRTDAHWRGGAEVDDALGGLDKDPRKIHPFRVVKLAGPAQKYAATELQRALAETIIVHEQMVSGSGAAVVLRELLLLKLVRPAARKKRS